MEIVHRKAGSRPVADGSPIPAFLVLEDESDVVAALSDALERRFAGRVEMDFVLSPLAELPFPRKPSEYAGIFIDRDSGGKPDEYASFHVWAEERGLWGRDSGFEGTAFSITSVPEYVDDARRRFSRAFAFEDCRKPFPSFRTKENLSEWAESTAERAYAAVLGKIRSIGGRDSK